MSTISAGTSSGTALVSTGDTTGELVIRTGASNAVAMTIGADQSVAFTGTVTGVPGANLQEFTSSGTWTKPAGANFVTVELWGAGGGGGSGRVSTLGTAASGGGGGGGGGYVSMTILASALSSNVAVTVGAGGAGGSAIATNSTNGVTGSDGGNSTFGSYVTSYGGRGGVGGITSSGTGGDGGGLLTPITARAGQFNGADEGGLDGAWGGASGSDSAAILGNLAGSSFQGGCGGGGGVDISTTVNNAGISGSGGGTPFGTAGSVAGFQQNGGNATGRAGGSGGGAGSLVNYNLSSRGAYGNGTFVLAADTTYYLTSTDAITWTERFTPFRIKGVEFDGSKFVFVTSTNEVYSTTNFSTYAQHTTAPLTAGFLNFKFQNGKYFVLGESRNLLVSDDLVTWTNLGANTGVTSGVWFTDVFYDGTNYVFTTRSSTASTTSAVIYTANLSTWTSTGVLGNGALYRIGGGDGKLILRCNTSPFAMYSTNNGVSWTNVATTLNANGANGDVVYIPSRTEFVTTSSSNIYTSGDGNNWTLQQDPTGSNYGVVISSGSVHFAASITSNPTVGIYATTSLATWTEATKAALEGNAGSGGNGGVASGGGGGGAALDGYSSGAGGSGGNGLCRVYTW
jgi:hypothetical protein